MKKITYCLLLLAGFTTRAQLMVSNTVQTPAQLVSDVLVDASVVPDNITFNGSALSANQVRSQAAFFNTNFNGTNLGIQSGVLLATGNAQVAIGPNNSGNASQPPAPGHAIVGDPDLQLLAPGNSIDNTTILEFDFVASGTELNFDYVFASEEYPEFANTSYNDVFGFFLSGPGISGPFSNNAKNIALIPGSTTPISINNVNNGQTNNGPCDNCAYYVNNGTGSTPAVNTTIQYDGFTTVLRASSSLICGQTYHIKLAIANVGDGSYDSAVFLKDFRIAPLKLLDGVGLDENQNTCFGTTSTLTVPPTSYFTSNNLTIPDYIQNPQNYTFIWSVNNTYDPANPGAYNPNPSAFTTLTTVTAPATIAATNYDVTVGGMYQLTIKTSYGCQVANDQIPIWFKPDPFQATQPVTICTTSTLPLDVDIDQTTAILGTANAGDYIITYYDSTADDALNGVPTGQITDPLTQYPMSTPTKDIFVRFEEVSGNACVIVKSFTVTVGEEPSGTLAYDVMCANSTTLPVPPSTNTVTPGGVYNTSSAGLVINPNNGAIDLAMSTPGNYTVNYHLAATATCPVFDVTNIPVQIVASPAAPTVSNQSVCAGDAVTLTASGLAGANFKWYAGAVGGTAATTAPTVNTSTPGTTQYFVSQSIGAGCEGPRAMIEVTVNAIPSAPAIAAAPHYCEGTPVASIAPIANLVTATGSLLWYDSLADTTGDPAAPSVNANTPGTLTYYVTQTANNCESARSRVDLIIDPLPAAPSVAVTSVDYCQNDTAAQLVATGTGLQWYASATSATAIPTPTPTTTALGTTIYYVSQTINACEGPRASVTVNVLAPPAAPVASAIPAVCAGTSVVLTDYIPASASYRWYNVATGGSAATVTPTVNTATPGTYDFYVAQVVGSCESPRSLLSVTVNPVPAAPTIAAAPHYCVGTPNASVAPVAGLVTASGSLLWYDDATDITGSTTAPVATAATAGTLTYYVTQTISNCESARAAVTVVIDALPVLPVYSTAGHLPTCDQPFGEIVFTPAAGTNYEFSIDAGATYQAGPAFSSLAPNSVHQVMVRDLVTGCVSATQAVTIGPIPANPPAPAVTAIQPTCAVNTGSFTVNSPTGTSFRYSIDAGVNYQAETTFAGLTPGTTYQVVVRDVTTGCVSAPTTVNIGPALNVPAAPTASQTVAANCVLPTATIVVSAPTGANLLYSIDGGTNFQASATFSGLAPGIGYSLIVKDNVSQCLSTATLVNASPLPAGPAAPTAAQTVAPNCIVTTGTVVVSAPAGANLEYSINGGTTYQTSGTFAGLVPGVAVSLSVRDVVTGCISAATVVNVSPIPANPAAPSATLIQPVCATPTGTITVTAPLGATLEYSIDGGASYQSGTVFSGLAAAATYGITVRNTATGCISSPASFSINAAPTVPATPAVTSADVCEGDTITLNTPTVAGATYNWTGPNGFTSSVQNPTITNAMDDHAGVYQLVIYTTADCPSNPGSVTVRVNPLPEPTLAQDGIICFNTQTNTGDTYVLNSGLTTAQYSFQWFASSGGTFAPISGETQGTLAVDEPGTYAVQATNLTTGCVSDRVQASVGMTSPPLSIKLLASDYFVENQSITAAVLPMGDYEYQLDNGPWQSSATFSNLPFGDHKVKVRNRCGELEDETTLIDYPKFFTPNGDGFNDNWNIFALAGRANTKIYIFDRYGKLLKQISPDGKGWDGTFNEQLVPAADYWFTVEYEEQSTKKTFKSHFALKR